MRRAASAAAALRVPGHEVVNVESARPRPAGPVRGAPRGARATWSKSNLPTLSSAHTYQLWGVINGQAISLGLSARRPTRGRFTFAGSPTPSKLGITVEPAGGSVVPTGSMLAAGTV